MRKEKAKSKETVTKQSTEYITTTEVRKVCRDIGIRDWTRLKDAKVTAKEAEIHPEVERSIGRERWQSTGGVTGSRKLEII